MKPEDVPPQLKEILDRAAGKDHSATGSVMTALAEILTVHEEAVRAESEEAFRILRAQHKAYRDMDEVGLELMSAYGDLIDKTDVRRWAAYSGEFDEELARIEECEKNWAKATCQCCVFGNHSLGCACDGEGCCHPEAYKEYDPSWGHGNWGKS
jgi:hypothetical protein